MCASKHIRCKDVTLNCEPQTTGGTVSLWGLDIANLNIIGML